MGVIMIIVGALFLAGPAVARAAISGNTGKLLMIKDDTAHLWYVSPINNKRYDLGSSGSEAVVSMRKVALGISSADLKKIPVANSSAKGDSKLRNRLAGRFLLAVQDRGMLWYVNPKDQKRYYLTNTSGSYQFFRSLATITSQKILDSILIAFAYPDKEKQVAYVPEEPAAEPSPSPAGCAYGNPACPSSQECNQSLNQCQLKAQTPAPVSQGCAYNNPACGEDQICTANVCIDVDKQVTQTPQQLLKTTPHAAQNYDEPGSNFEIAIDPQAQFNVGRVYIQAEQTGETGVTFSVWDKTENGCRFDVLLTMSPLYDGSILDRSYVQLLGLDANGRIKLSISTGQIAYQRCFATHYDKMDCNRFPHQNAFTVSDGLMSRIFDGYENSEFNNLLLNIDSHGRQVIFSNYPALAKMAPIGAYWDFVISLKNESVLNRARMNFVYINFLPNSTLDNLQHNSSLLAKYGDALERGEINFPFAVTDLHEFTHMLLYNTEFNTFCKPGTSCLLGEGLADYLSYSQMLNQEDVAVKNTSCGAVGITSPGSPDDGVAYKDGWKSWAYDVGYCFFKKTEDTCGRDAMNLAFASLLDRSYHPTQSYPSFFKALSDACSNKAAYANILDIFGFSQSVLYEQYPLTSQKITVPKYCSI